MKLIFFKKTIKDKHIRVDIKLITSRWVQLLEWICLSCAVLLFVVWPLSGTIAARNITLVIGSLCSLAWLYQSKPNLSLKSLFPVLCLLAVPVWLCIHYWVLTVDSAIQLYELKGTWVRVTLSIIMGGGLGLMIANRPYLIYWLWFAMALLPVLSLLNYFREAWLLKDWVIHNYHFPYKGKFALVNFLTYLFLLACSIVHLTIHRNEFVKQTTNRTTLLGLSLLTICICWIIFLYSQALNGALIAVITTILLLIILIKSIILKPNKNIKIYFLILSFMLLSIIFALTFWSIDQKKHQKLHTIFDDISISMKIDEHIAWQEDSRLDIVARPTNSLGLEINHSTYSRTAWFMKGLDLLQKNPIGTGFSHLAFRYYFIQENPYSRVIMTHSGWLDYALGLGLPGLMLTWLAMFLVIRQAYIQISVQENPPLTSYLAIWIIGGVWLLWWSTELAEREFIEQLFFIIAMFATTKIYIKKFDFFAKIQGDS